MSLARMSLQLIVLHLIGVSVLKIEAATEPKFSRDLQVETHNGAISVPSGFNLYTIAMTNKTMKINSTEITVNSCSLNIDPFEDTIKGIARAVLINHSNQIIVWGVHAEDRYNTYFSLLAIRQIANACSYKSALQVPDDDRLEGYFYSTPLPLVYGQQDGFLVFFPSQRHCWPCRFNALAEIVRQLKSLETDGATLTMSSIHMQPFDQTNVGRGGWFYAANFPNRTAVVKLIDDELNVTRRAYLNFSVQAIAANHKLIRNSGACSTNANQIVCRRFDSKLRVVQSINVSFNDTVSAVSLEYDANGNWFVAAAAALNVYVYVYNVDGQLIHSLDFGQFERNFKIREFRGYIALEQRVYHYCLFVFQEKTIHARHSIRCISNDDYVRASK